MRPPVFTPIRPAAPRAPSWVALLGALLLAACGGGDGGTAPPPVPPTITLSSSTIELRGVGTEGTLSATVTPAGAVVSWTADQPAVATVTAIGATATVRAVSGGTATIVAAVTANGVRAELRATVTVVPLVRSIVLAPAAATLLPGVTVQLTPTVSVDAGASSAVTFSSSDPARASVNASGLVTAVAPGVATITATSNATSTISAQSVITVAEPPRVRRVTVSPGTDTVLVGATRTFTAIVEADSALATTVTWRSSTPAVATMSAAGLATAVSAGTTTITAISTADTTMRASATLHVRAPAVQAVSVSGPTTLIAGTVAQLVAQVTADPGATTTVSWTTSAPAVASVNAAGLVSALAPGTAVIRARSTLSPTIEGTRSITVTAAPALTQWTAGVLGTVGGQFTDGGGRAVASLDASTALASYWELFDGASPAYAVRLANGVVSNVSPPGNVVLGGFTSAEPGIAFGRGPVSAEVWRYSAGSWARLPLNLPAPAAQVYALAGGRVRAGVRLAGAFSVQEWTGSAWTQRASLPLPTSPAGESFSSLGPSAMTFVLQANSGTTHQLWQWDGTNVSALPLVPGNPANRAPILFGASLTSIYAISGNGQTQLHRFDGSAWTPLTSGLAGDTLVDGVICDGQPVVRGFRGRVYRLAGSSWQRLGTDAELLPDRFFGSAARDIACAVDGTLRTIAGDGSLARWDGTRWVVEAFAPSLRATKVVTPTLGWATGGAYSVYRWNGSAWSLAYRDHAIFEQRVMGLAAWPDGRFMGALWSSTGPADGTSLASNPQGILRYDGSDWTREVGGALVRANAVWGPRYDNAFTVTGDGTILQFNGSAWTERASVGQALFAIDGVGDDHALAIGTDLATWRWNGAAWSQAAAGVPGLIGATRLYVAAVNDAWSATNAGLVYRFNGTAWSQVNMSAAGGSTNTWAIFGTGPNDVFVLRGPLVGARRLYRWNGAAWSLVSTFAPGSLDIPQAGSAVPGFGVVVGNNARWWRGGGS